MKRKMPWFRVYVDFLSNHKLVGLSFEDQRHYIGVLALKRDDALDQDCSTDLLDRIVAQRLWIDPSDTQQIKNRLIEAKLIDQNWQPNNWQERQPNSDTDPTGAERQKRFRERDKKQNSQANNALRNGTDNAAVTLPDTDTDTDTDTDQSKRKKNTQKQKFTSPTENQVSEFAADTHLNLDGFFDHYESVGWVVGKAKTPMKCWHSAARNWNRRQTSFNRESNAQKSHRTRRVTREEGEAHAAEYLRGIGIT